MGPCALYPDGVYEYGQIGIGTCLSGPTELAWTDDAAGEPVLLVTNANPYHIFTSGSLLSIPWSGVDLGLGRQLITETGAAAYEMPDFVGGLAVKDDTALVAVRLSEDSRVRQSYDDLHLVDLTDPLAPAASARGTGGGATVEVQSDPVDVVVDSSSGYAFVANRTTHSISVLDASGEELKVIQPWPEATLSSAEWSDADASGSTAEIGELEIYNDELVTDDRWTLSWVEGTWRIWVGDEEGLSRSSTTGDGVWWPSALGTELENEDLLLGGEMVDPHFAGTGLMVFGSQGYIQQASASSFLADWNIQQAPILTGREGEWDSWIGAPALAIDLDGYWLFYEGATSEGASGSIGLAFSGDGLIYGREGLGEEGDEPVLASQWAHEAGGIGDPFVYFDEETDRWHMYYSAFDGERWTVGHARSPDLITWTSDETPIFAVEGVDVAAPAVSQVSGAWRMFYARNEGSGWSIWEARSPDGLRWTELGAVPGVDLGEHTLAEQPDGPALQTAVSGAFAGRGEQAGSLLQPIAPGEGFASVNHGWRGKVLAGPWLESGALGPESEGGLQVDAVDRDAGLAWLTITSAGGVRRIVAAQVDAVGDFDLVEGSTLEPGDGAERDGVGNAVVFAQDGGYVMYYGGLRGRTWSIQRATSADGLSWERQGTALSAGSSWDAGGVLPGSVETLQDGSLRLWYSGSDGDAWRIGAAAVKADGSLIREGESAILSTGSAGDWDDSGVRDPYVLPDLENPGAIHLWYAGSDGGAWRVGYAWRSAEGEEFQFSESEQLLSPRPVVSLSGSLFHNDGALRPVLWQADDGRWEGWYAGKSDDVDRVGRVVGDEPDRLRRVPRRPTPGDLLTFATERGDAGALAIPLDGSFDQTELTGIGLTSLTVDEERGFLYAVSKMLPYIFVIDIRDDSTAGFQDLNYLDIEAVLPARSSSGADGFRQVLPVPGESRIYALNDSPEGVWIFDISLLVDDEWGEFLHETQVGWMPTPRGADEDEGVLTQASVGPGQMLMHPDGRRLFVTNFNANSIGVYDLALGPHGTLVHEVPLVGENPYAMLLTPDARHLVFANYTGEVDATELALGTLAVLDVDPESPTYLEVLTWIADN